MGVTAISETDNTVIHQAVASGGAGPPARAMALTDGNGGVATAGIARAVDLSAVPASISATGHTTDIDVSAFSYLFWAVTVAAVSGGSSPTITFAVDYSDGAGNVLASGVVSTTAFTGAGATYTNVGPVAGGGGFVIPRAIQIRWTVTGTPTAFTGVSMKMYGR